MSRTKSLNSNRFHKRFKARRPENNRKLIPLIKRITGAEARIRFPAEELARLMQMTEYHFENKQKMTATLQSAAGALRLSASILPGGHGAGPFAHQFPPLEGRPCGRPMAEEVEQPPGLPFPTRVPQGGAGTADRIDYREVESPPQPARHPPRRLLDLGRIAGEAEAQKAFAARAEGRAGRGADARLVDEF